MNRNRRPFLVYNSLLLPLLPPLWLYTQWRRYGQKKSAASVRGMWGKVPPEARRNLQQSTLSTPVVWIHAVSVGEVMAARPLARAIRQEMPRAKIAMSVTTDTGMETARAAQKAGEVDALLFYPLDTPVAVRRALNAVRPHAFITVETELWPNFLAIARQRGVRTFLANGRVSDNLQRQVPRIAALWRWMMSNFSGLLMRSEYDAQRLREMNASLGAEVENIQVVGDVKLDFLPDSEAQRDWRAQWRQTLHIAPVAPVVVAGSTHPGEEEVLIAAWQTLRATWPQLRLVLAPRHIERVEEVQALCQSRGVATVRRSQVQTASDAVIVLDTVGELSQLYAAADVAFVGGSLIERGGHNMLEPVLRGVPVLSGPHVANFREAAALVESGQLGRMVSDEKELVETAREWLQNDERQHIGARAEVALAPHRGAALRVAQVVKAALAEKTAQCV
jgi:3-deoxy-D-manno-octulosonic-acid transferase